MTDPQNYDWRNYEYLYRGEPLGSTSLWMLGIGTALLIGFLVIVSYSSPTDTASNNAPNATSNSPPRIGPSTPGSGAQPEKPTPLIHGGPSR